MKKIFFAIMLLLPFFAFAAETKISPTREITKIKNGFSVVEFSGEDCFEELLAGGGASSDKDVLSFVTKNFFQKANKNRKQIFFHLNKPLSVAAHSQSAIQKTKIHF